MLLSCTPLPTFCPFFTPWFSSTPRRRGPVARHQTKGSSTNATLRERERKGEKGSLALQFFHQNFLFNLPACCSNCEAPCCRASAAPRGTVCQWRCDRCGPLSPTQPRRLPSKLRPGGASRGTRLSCTNVPRIGLEAAQLGTPSARSGRQAEKCEGKRHTIPKS